MKQQRGLHNTATASGACIKQLINYMEYCAPLEAHSTSTHPVYHETLRLITMFIHYTSPPVRITSQIIPVYTLPPSFKTILIGCYPRTIAQALQVELLRIFPRNVSMQLPQPSRVLLNSGIPIICGQSIIMKNLAIGSIPFSCDFLSLSSDRSPQHTVFRSLQSVLFALYEPQNFIPI